VIARFIPGGRTATTFTAGLVKLSWPRRFAPYIAVAAVLWAAYGVLLGYLGGRTFRDKPIYALLLAFGIAALIVAAVEIYRRLRSDR
jgi:membrane protein DedA with SNARE-associated domain